MVRLVRIRDVTARVEWNDLAAEQTKLELQIPQIDVQGLGEEGGGLTGSELSNVITKAILGSIARSGGNLPREMLSGLESGLRGLSRLPGAAGKALGGLLEKDEKKE